MRVFIVTGKQLLLPCLFMALSVTLTAHSEVVDPRFKLDTMTLKDISPPQKAHKSAQQHSKKPEKLIVKTGDEIVLRVKAGDTIEKLLMRDCSLTNEEATKFCRGGQKKE